MQDRNSFHMRPVFWLRQSMGDRSQISDGSREFGRCKSGPFTGDSQLGILQAGHENDSARRRRERQNGGPNMLEGSGVVR